MKTIAEYKECLKDKTLKFLQDQTSPLIVGFNGANYDAAIRELIRERMAQGEVVERVQRSHILKDEEEGHVEVVSYGGKGGTLRIVHPVSSS